MKNNEVWLDSKQCIASQGAFFFSLCVIYSKYCQAPHRKTSHTIQVSPLTTYCMLWESLTVK